jgi:hypothetical protein
MLLSEPSTAESRLDIAVGNVKNDRPGLIESASAAPEEIEKASGEKTILDTSPSQR